jgi:hypothetical protein
VARCSPQHNQRLFGVIEVSTWAIFSWGGGIGANLMTHSETARTGVQVGQAVD